MVPHCGFSVVVAMECVHFGSARYMIIGISFTSTFRKFLICFARPDQVGEADYRRQKKRLDTRKINLKMAIPSDANMPHISRHILNRSILDKEINPFRVMNRGSKLIDNKNIWRFLRAYSFSEICGGI